MNVTKLSAKTNWAGLCWISIPPYGDPDKFKEDIVYMLIPDYASNVEDLRAVHEVREVLRDVSGFRRELWRGYPAENVRAFFWRDDWGHPLLTAENCGDESWNLVYERDENGGQVKNFLEKFFSIAIVGTVVVDSIAHPEEFREILQGLREELRECCGEDDARQFEERSQIIDAALLSSTS